MDHTRAAFNEIFAKYYDEFAQAYAKLQQQNDFLQQENADLKKQIVDLQLSSRPSMNASAPEFKPPTTVKLPAGQATVNQAAEQSTVKQPAGKATVNQPAEQSTVKQPAGQSTVKPPAEQSTVKQPAGKATVNQAAEQSTVKQPAGQATVNQAAEQSTVKQPAGQSTVKPPAGQATVAQPPPEEKKVQFVDEAAEMAKAKAIKSATAKYNALSRLPQEGRKVFDISYKKNEKSLSVLEFFCSIGLPKTRNQLEKYSKSLKEEERSEQSCGVTMFMLYHFTTSKTRTSDQDFVDYLCSKKGCIQDEDFFRDVYSKK